MYPPPPSDIIAKLVGRRVELLSFGEYTLHIALDNLDVITITCPFRFSDGTTIEESPIQEFPLTSSNMLRLIGVSIDHAECEADGTLSLRFTNGDGLVAYANDPYYEAYTLRIIDQEYVV
jgi:Family of unknown function (DUF6188)